MTETKKINLSAMMKHANKGKVDSGERESPLKDKVKTEVKQEKSPINNTPVEKKINIEKKVVDKIISPISISNKEKIWIEEEINKSIKTTKPRISSKISLSTIKSVKEKKIVIAPVKKKVIKDEKTLYYEALTSKVIIHEDKKAKISTLKTPLKSEKTILLKKTILKSQVWLHNNISKIEKDNTKIDISIDETSCEIAKKDEYIANQKNIDEKKDVFSNYESDYKKKETSILGTIKELTKIANLKKLTKTNKIFVWWIIATTVLWISFLFYVDPEVHSIENYKVSLLNLAGKAMTQEEMDSHQTDIMNDIAWKLSQNNLGWYDLNFEILVNDMWMAVYKFDGSEYKNKIELDIAIQEKLIELKLDKIRNYLKNK